MRFPFRIWQAVLPLAAAACGSFPVTSLDDDLVPNAPPARASRQVRIEAGPLYTPTPADVIGGDHRPRGPVLADVVDRVYFVTSRSAPAPTERIDLRVVGTEEVVIYHARLVDDAGSPFGIGAAEHFELTMPSITTIAPGGTVGLQVRFLADTMEMQNAFLDIRTSAENMPFIRIALTGKVFPMP